MIPFGDWEATQTFENENTPVPDYLSTQIDPPEYDTEPEHGLLCDYCGMSHAYTVMEFGLVPILLCYWCSILSTDDINYEIGQI